MNFEQVIKELNWLAVAVAALSTFLIGGIWYAVFSKAWMKANNIDQAYLSGRNMALVFGLALVLSFVMALVLAMFIGKNDAVFGLIAGFMAGFAWVSLGLGVIALFEKRPLTYVLINGGYMTLSFSLMGLILGAWK